MRLVRTPIWPQPVACQTRPFCGSEKGPLENAIEEMETLPGARYECNTDGDHDAIVTSGTPERYLS